VQCLVKHVIMAGMDAVSRLLDRNRELISRELESTKIVGLLVKKGVLSVDEEQAVNSHTDANLRCDAFVRVLAQKGLTAFRELCYALEHECPHVLTSLLVDAGSNNPTSGIVIVHLTENNASFFMSLGVYRCNLKRKHFHGLLPVWRVK